MPVCGFCYWYERQYSECDCNEIPTEDREAGF